MGSVVVCVVISGRGGFVLMFVWLEIRNLSVVGIVVKVCFSFLLIGFVGL